MNMFLKHLNNSSVDKDAADELSFHQSIVKAATPPALLTMSESNLDSIKTTVPVMPHWLKSASPHQRAELRRKVEASVAAHTALNQVMAAIQSPAKFCEPLLKSALEETVGHAIDVNDTFFDMGGTQESLLERAMQNFDTAVPDDFYRVRFFSVSEQHGINISPYGFMWSCRQLNLGKQYQEYIKRTLTWDDPSAQAQQREKYISYHKCALAAASQVAVLKGDIEPKHHRALMATICGEPSSVEGQKTWARSLSYMEMPLHGCLVLEIAEPYEPDIIDDLTAVFHPPAGNEVIVYMPDDPDSPVKYYPTFAAFKANLTRQLMPRSADEEGAKPTAYQKYFSRFFRYNNRARFFNNCTETVLVPFGKPKRRQKRSLDFLLQLRILDSTDDPWAGEIDIWGVLYREFRDGMLMDARSQVVPTEDADARKSQEIFPYLVELGLVGATLLSFAIPPLGAVMLGISAVQLMYESLEGMEELGIGDTEAGWGHIGDVLETLVSGVVTAGFLGSLTTEFTAIELANGDRRLWKPDLSNYHHDVSLAGVPPNELNQCLVDGKRYVHADGHVVEQSFDPKVGKWRANHPSRSKAYQPVLDQDSQGHWYVALDQNPPRIAPGTAMPSMVGKGIGNAAYARYAVHESEIAGLGASKGIYRSADGQRFYIRNLDETGRVSIYQIRDAFNVGGDIQDVNIVDPNTHRAAEVRLWQMGADQWHKLSLSGGNNNVAETHLITPSDLTDCHLTIANNPGATQLRRFSTDRGLSLPTLERYVTVDGSLTAEGVEFIEHADLPKKAITEEHLSNWLRLSSRDRTELTREGFANRYRLDAEAFMKRVNEDGTLNPVSMPDQGAPRKQLPSGLWEPRIATQVSERLADIPIDWGQRFDDVSFVDELADIRQALSIPQFARHIVNTNLFETVRIRYSLRIAEQLANRQGGGRFLFTMRRVTYSGATQGQFHAIRIVDIEAGELVENTNAVSGYWAPQGGYVDVPVHPGWSEPDFVFTPGFSGCSLTVDQLEENMLRVRHVEGGKENAQYNDLPAEAHGWGMSGAMEYLDYGLQPDLNNQVDSRLAGFAFMKYDRNDGIWNIHYQSVQGAPNITRYSTLEPGLFSASHSRVTVFSQSKVRGTMARRVTTVESAQ